MTSRFRYALAALLGGLTLVAAPLLSAGATAVPAAPSSTAGPPTSDRADAAAGWLARQLVDGERLETEFGGVSYPDQGLTIDAVFAFAAARVADRPGARATAWLAEPDVLAGYVGDGTTESYAGALAKLALAAQVRAQNPRSFGGVDLIGRLRALQAPSGRFSDRSAFGDFSNAFSQSLAILALDRTRAGAPPAAVAYLAASQCADGSMPVQFEQAECVGDVDATAIAVQALLATGRSRDAREAAAWLVSVQAPGGGFAAGDGTGDVNANSTGLAAAALQLAGRTAAAARARAVLRGLQIGCAGAPADRGAVAFDATGFDPATATRATTQAVLGLTGANLAILRSAGSRPAAPVLACPTPTSGG